MSSLVLRTYWFPGNVACVLSSLRPPDASPHMPRYERGVQLLSDPAKDKPSAWTKAGVPRKVVAAFTGVQYAVLAGMIWFKGCPIGVLFPVIIAMLGPLRLQLHNAGFSKEHLEALDAEEN